MLDELINKVKSGERITRNEASFLYAEVPDDVLAELATVAKSRLHNIETPTYLIMAIINYTNICVAKCDYCSFYRLPHQSGTYLLNYEQIKAKISACVELGGTMVGFNGGFHPKLRISDYAGWFQKVRDDFGQQIEFYGMTVAEFMFCCRVSKLSYDDGAAVLAKSGSKWITGGGAEILDDNFRLRHSPGKYQVADYFSAQAAILKSGMGSTATMVIGFDETLEERMNHLEDLRNFQDQQANKLPSFLCWTYKPYHNQLGGKEISTQEYLRWLAISRIYLDNIEHIRTSVLTKNEDALKGLFFGANDFDLPTEDEVTQSAGATISLDFAKILQQAKKMGFSPRLRAPFGHASIG